MCFEKTVFTGMRRRDRSGQCEVNLQEAAEVSGEGWDDLDEGGSSNGNGRGEDLISEEALEACAVKCI